MTTTTPDPDRPLRGRRLTWAEFRRLVGEPLQPANHNEDKQEAA